ncbi:MAG: hypothetical protein VB034_07115 [Eubacteriales bacterium]|nr:hypothetical protein [Eubacteriales bacterium]
MENDRSDLSLEPLGSDAEKQSQSESFSTLDYVRELYLNSEEQKKLELKKVRLVRTGVIFLSIIMVAVVLSCVLIVPAVLNTASEADKALALVQKIDVETIAADVDALVVQANTTFVEVGNAVQVLNNLDMKTLNDTIGQLEIAVDSFSTLDVATLNTAIANLNATVEPLARLFGKK